MIFTLHSVLGVSWAKRLIRINECEYFAGFNYLPFPRSARTCSTAAMDEGSCESIRVTTRSDALSTGRFTVVCQARSVRATEVDGAEPTNNVEARRSGATSAPATTATRDVFAGTTGGKRREGGRRHAAGLPAAVNAGGAFGGAFHAAGSGSGVGPSCRGVPACERRSRVQSSAVRGQGVRKLRRNAAFNGVAKRA